MTHKPPELTLRAKKILGAIVQEYLQSGDAVGSRTVTRRHGIDLSPATVRNVMADLEELGLLAQPHTSAGRVPTHEGLRFFIRSLLKVRSLTAREKDEIRARPELNVDDLKGGDLDEALGQASRVLSELAQQTTILVAPSPDHDRLTHLEFMRLPSGDVLAVLVSSSGHVENRLLQVALPAEPSFLERANNYLRELVVGLTMDEVRARVLEELGRDKDQLDVMTARALELGRSALAPSTSTPSVIVSGQAHLVDHTAGPLEPDRMRALLGALEEKERLVRLLDRARQADGIQVWLGAETPFATAGELSVVASTYGQGDRPVGTIAVVGPTRMNYSKVIPLVDFTAEILSDVLGRRR